MYEAHASVCEERYLILTTGHFSKCQHPPSVEQKTEPKPSHTSVRVAPNRTWSSWRLPRQRLLRQRRTPLPARAGCIAGTAAVRREMRLLINAPAVAFAREDSSWLISPCCLPPRPLPAAAHSVPVSDWPAVAVTVQAPSAAAPASCSITASITASLDAIEEGTRQMTTSANTSGYATPPPARPVSLPVNTLPSTDDNPPIHSVAAATYSSQSGASHPASPLARAQGGPRVCPGVGMCPGVGIPAHSSNNSLAALTVDASPAFVDANTDLDSMKLATTEGPPTPNTARHLEQASA